MTALALLSPAASAQAPSPAPSGETLDPAARFDLAEQRYREGRYEEAAEILSSLAASFPEPVLLYNLGRAYESAGQLEAAIEAYSRYLEVAPDAADADAVRARAGRLRERADAARAAASQPEPPPPPVLVQSPRPPRRPIARAAPWTLVGLGGAGLVAGIALAATARARNRNARDEPTQTRAADLDAQAQNLALAANVTLAVGGAVAIAGLTWGLVRLRRDRARSHTTTATYPVRF